MKFWKVYCLEDYWPGLWQRWFKNQCVAVGWGPHEDFSYVLGQGRTGEGWAAVRNALKQISKGDWVVVQLKQNRVGRIGEVVGKQVREDEWQPLVPRSETYPEGEMGRRINVRWDLTVGPTQPEIVVKLPPGHRLPAGLSMGTIKLLPPSVFTSIKRAVNDEANWVSLIGRFGYESALSDYIAMYPQKLEDGLQPYPSAKVRERVFDDKSRSDVLLIDRNERPVVVECKQDGPDASHVRQIRRYMRNLRRETRKRPRGILVHGGATKLNRDIRRVISSKPPVGVVQYSLRVDFVPCR